MTLVLKQGPRSTDFRLGRSESLGEGQRLFENNFKIVSIF